MVLETLRSIIESRQGSTMYLFYDERQFVQGSTIPKFLVDADCKLTFYVNCRNTELIAKSSLNALNETKDIKLKKLSNLGGPPLLLANSEAAAQEAFVDEQIAALKSAGINDIVIITCKTIDGSKLSECFTDSNGYSRWKGQKSPSIP